MEENEHYLDVAALAKVLLKRIWIVILSAIIAAVFAFCYTSYFIPKKYTSYTTLYVVNTVDYASTYSANDLAVAQNLASSYVEFITSNSTLSAVSKDINNAYSVSQLKGIVSAATLPDTQILKVTVVCESKSDAKAIASLVAQEGKKQIVRILQDGRTQVKAGNVSVIDEACDAYISYPNVKNNTVFGAFIGLILSAIIIIVVELLDKRIKTTEQINELFGYDVIGIIPSIQGGNRNA